MRAAFVTAVQLGLSCMESIYAAGGRLDLLITLHDAKAPKKSGRVYLDDFARVHQVPFLKVDHINDASAAEAIRARGIDWMCIIGWSQIAGAEVLAAPRLGALGIHPTLLPEGRGRAAIPWAILKGLPRTGVTLFKLAAGVDAGPIAAQVEIPLAPYETAASLYTRVNQAHIALIRQSWPKLTAGSLVFIPQDESRATYWPGRTPADGRILPSMTVDEVDRLVRATTRPYPGAFFVESDATIRIWAGRVVENENVLEVGYRLRLADGWFEATDSEREHSEPA